MSTTAKDIIQGAVARRTANDPDKLFSIPEMISALSFDLQMLYADVAESYPMFFAKDERVDPTDLGWLQPTDMIFVFRVETVAGTIHITVPDIPAVLVLFGFPADQKYDIDVPATPMDSVFKLCKWLEGGPGTEAFLRANMLADYGITDDQLDAVLTPAAAGGRDVAIVPLLDKQAEEGVPRVYQLNRYFHSVGEDGDPVEEYESIGGDGLVFFGPMRHPALDPSARWDATANTLDPTWPEHRNDLLISKLALYLAIKDGRGQDEVTVLQAEVDRGTTLLMREAQLGHEYKRSRRWTDRPPE